MPIQPGTRLDDYEVEAFVGEGGMSKVYRARDTHLKREVAIKVLLENFTHHPDRVARFEREARLLAQMTHPNIGVIHDLKRSGALVYLVLEFVHGETLADRLKRGPLPWKEALRIVRQIAMALEATHAKGVIHRDLKPENVMITRDGIVKVLDFGLAKEIFGSMVVRDDGQTVSGPALVTEERTIVGTVAYMSPEQARGEPLDKRTDIWSFGCTLFEVLAGRRPFEGKSVADLLGAIVNKQPDFDALPSDLPPDIRKLLRRCLQKDLSQRLRDIGDARLEIESALEAPEAHPAGGSTRASWKSAASLLSIAYGAGLLSMVLLLWPQISSPPLAPARKFALELPPAEPMSLDDVPGIAITSDGTALVYTVARGETTELRRRYLHQLESERVAGTEGAQGPFFRFGTADLAFFARSQLYLLENASPLRMDESESPRGGSWVSNRIVFSPRTESGLFSTLAHGASATELTKLDSGKGERSHRWPSILPDGKLALFTSWNGEGFDIEYVNLRSGETDLLVRNGTYPRFSPTGHLLFVRNFALMAQAFDESAVEVSGEPKTVVEDVHFDPRTGAAFYDLSSDGTLVYAPREEAADDEVRGRLLSVRSKDGAPRVLTPASKAYQRPRLSPSGRSLLAIVDDRGSADVWSFEPERGTLSRLTFDGQVDAAVWTHSGNRIAFSSQHEGGYRIVSQPIDATEPDRVLTESETLLFPTSWSRDGKLAFVVSGGTNNDVWIWTERAGGKAEPFLDRESNESAGVFSPDGRFLAYVSDETGEDEVYVRPVDGSSGSRPISTGGGREPVWRGDGAELYYRNDETMMAVAIVTVSGFEPGKPRELFPAPFDAPGALYAGYDVSPDGTEFYVVRSTEGREATRLIVVVNWFSELLDRVPRSN